PSRCAAATARAANRPSERFTQAQKMMRQIIRGGGRPGGGMPGGGGMPQMPGMGGMPGGAGGRKKKGGGKKKGRKGGQSGNPAKRAQEAKELADKRAGKT